MLAILEAINVINIIPLEFYPLFTLVVGILMLIMRFLTDTAVFHSDSENNS
jgi:hypothetical protein